MPKAYWVVTYRSVKNPEAWQAYAKQAAPACQEALKGARHGNVERDMRVVEGKALSPPHHSANG